MAETKNNRYAVVTGSNKGLGFAICRQLASQGITVVVTARDEKRGLEALEKLKGLGLSDFVIFHQLDVSDPASIASFAQFIQSHIGKLDILRKRMSKNVKVCVTGGAGYIASYLIKHLLERGYTVHATLRNLNDASKVGLLKGLAHAETNLKLFEADIYNSDEFAAAIDGCTFVLHLATPKQHYGNNSQHKNIAEASVAGVKIIVDSCIKSKTVKRLIYTSSVSAAAPLKEDGSGYKDVMDEECWTPPNVTSGMFSEYIQSKLLAEKEALAYNGKGIEVVSLALPTVAGDTVQSSIAISMRMLISQPLRDEEAYKHLRDLEDLTAKIPFAHIRDVAEAHIFSIENPHINGRFIVANSFLTSAEIASIILKLHPDLTIPPEFIEEFKREIKWGVRKLQDLGFEYKYDAEKTIDATVVWAKRLGKF